jgi:hypothetical protein
MSMNKLFLSFPSRPRSIYEYSFFSLSPGDNLLLVQWPSLIEARPSSTVVLELHLGHPSGRRHIRTVPALLRAAVCSGFGW